MTEAAYTITDARYAKGRKIIHVLDSRGGMKGRASWLAEAVGGRYVNRSKGYCVSPTQADKFEKLFNAGFDGGLEFPKGVVLCRTTGKDIPVRVNQAIKIIDDILYEARCVEINPASPIAQCSELVCRKPLTFRPDGKGKFITIRPRDRLWVTNNTETQRRFGAVFIDRQGKGAIGQGWGFKPDTLAEFFLIEPDRQDVAA